MTLPACWLLPLTSVMDFWVLRRRGGRGDRSGTHRRGDAPATTEKPKEGQVPRSRELTTTMLLLGGTAGLMLFSSFMLEGLLALFREGFALDRQLIFLRDAGLWQLGRLLGAAAIVLAPLCALLFLLAALTPVALGGWSFSERRLRQVEQA